MEDAKFLSNDVEQEKSREKLCFILIIHLILVKKQKVSKTATLSPINKFLFQFRAVPKYDGPEGEPNGYGFANNAVWYMFHRMKGKNKLMIILQ